MEFCSSVTKVTKKLAEGDRAVLTKHPSGQVMKYLEKSKENTKKLQSIQACSHNPHPCTWPWAGMQS